MNHPSILNLKHNPFRTYIGVARDGGGGGAGA